MLTVRTDLAVEAHALWRESAGETTRLKGVAAREEQAEGMTVTRVEILDQEGARALGKPEGTYLTLDVSPSGGGRRMPSPGRSGRWRPCWGPCCRRRDRCWRRGWAIRP